MRLSWDGCVGRRRRMRLSRDGRVGRRRCMRLRRDGCVSRRRCMRLRRNRCVSRRRCIGVCRYWRLRRRWCMRLRRDGCVSRQRRMGLRRDGGVRRQRRMGLRWGGGVRRQRRMGFRWDGGVRRQRRTGIRWDGRVRRYIRFRRRRLRGRGQCRDGLFRRRDFFVRWRIGEDRSIRQCCCRHGGVGGCRSRGCCRRIARQRRESWRRRQLDGEGQTNCGCLAAFVGDRHQRLMRAIAQFFRREGKGLVLDYFGWTAIE